MVSNDPVNHLCQFMMKSKRNNSMVEYLEWDSIFFGLRIGRVKVSSQEEMNALFAFDPNMRAEYDLVYIFAKHGLIANSSNATLLDTKTVYRIAGELAGAEYDEHIIDYPDRIVSEELMSLALASGVYSRFRLDKNLPQGSYEKLYSCWIQQSVKRIISTEVFCYMIEGHPRGFLSLNREGDKGVIGLVATDNSFRGRGIGIALLRHVIKYCENKGIKTITVATQMQNIPACRLYEKAGFVVESYTDVWHWWL